jgi:inorganic phosphate transporter, PiT family
VWLLVTTTVAVPLAFVGIRAARRALRRASRGLVVPLRRTEVLTTASLALAHGSNDAQKTMGLLTLALVASGHLARLVVPLWVVLVAAASLTVGTSFGGWRVVRTLGRGIFPLRVLEGVVSQTSAALIVLAGSLAGAPISTTDVVAPAIVGVGAGEQWRRVRWRVVSGIGAAWLVTLPVCAALGALALPLWRALA